MKYEKLVGKALGCRYIVTAIFTVIMWGILFALYHFFGKSLVINVIIISAAGLFLLNLIIGPIFRHRFYKYNINDEYIDIVEGYISVQRQIVPIERIHKLEMDAGPFARMFGLTDITVTTAGGDVLISYIEAHRAEEIADKLRKRINNIVTEQRKEEQEKLLEECRDENKDKGVENIE